MPHRDLFLPNVLDEAIHHRPAHGFPADGVAGVRPLSAVRTGVEGLC